jgi:hypothetical protein
MKIILTILLLLVFIGLFVSLFGVFKEWGAESCSCLKYLGDNPDCPRHGGMYAHLEKR